MEEKLKDKIGKIVHYYDKIGVAIIELSGKLKVGDSIRIKGNGIDFEQEVSSMQIEHEDIKEAKKGETIGLKIEQKAKEGDEVYLV